MRNPVKDLRIVGYAEGVSYLLLLGIAMPLKYLADLPGAVRVVGMIHGILFVVYVLVGLRTAWLRRWGIVAIISIVAASLLPFGPFLLDRWLGREETEVAPCVGMQTAPADNTTGTVREKNVPSVPNPN